MADAKIDTLSVEEAADYLKKYNTKMNEEFEILQGVISKLKNSWSGSAADNAFSGFNSFASSYKSSRYSVIQSYVTYLIQQVDPGYTQAESTNESLADGFK